MTGKALKRRMHENVQLMNTFREKFRNITRIMDCVTCDKCCVWGKLQILGLGTAIRILLSSDEMLSGPEGVLSRQEVVALVNTLHQLSTSVAFAARATDLELEGKLSWVTSPMMCTMIAAAVLLLGAVPSGFTRHKRNEEDVEGEDGEVEQEEE